MAKQKSKGGIVKLREKNLSDGRKSLYLDIYREGARTYEFLKIYVMPEHSSESKAYNRQMRHAADLRRMEVESAIIRGEYQIKDEKSPNIKLLDFFETLVAHRFETGVSYDTWVSVRKHLKAFPESDIELKKVDVLWMERFKSFLLRRVAQNSAHTYFNKLKSTLHEAFRQKLIEVNPADDVTSPKIVDTEREYLTTEELEKLFATDCRYPQLKYAFLFSAMTGLRKSDILKLKWEDIIHDSKTGWSVRYTQTKTKNFEFLHTTEEVVSVLDFMKKENSDHKEDDLVFPDLKFTTYMYTELTKWMLKAGITKDITFHNARHTYATLSLLHGTGLSVISNMLGHRDIRTTMRYAKVTDVAKMEAAKQFPKIKMS